MHLAFHPSSLRSRLRLAPLALLVALALPPAANAGPTLGFRENWPGTSVQGWGGSIDITFSNPGTGGLLGGGDGYLLLTKVPPKGHFGTRSVGTEYAGNWQAAGITQIRLWLNDVNTADAFQIHVAIGQFGNLWQYNQAFLPPLNQWGEFTVDLTDSANFSHIISISGLGFNFALQNVEVLHIRHDLPPFTQLPDSIYGDLGIDELLLTNGIVGVESGPRAAVHPVDLAPPYPNPSRGPVAVSVTTGDGSEVRLQIVDVQGRLVRDAEMASGSPGPRLWVWDGRDDRGRSVPPGAYRVRATGPSGGTSRPLVRVR